MVRASSSLCTLAVTAGFAVWWQAGLRELSRAFTWNGRPAEPAVNLGRREATFCNNERFDVTRATAADAWGRMVEVHMTGHADETCGVSDGRLEGQLFDSDGTRLGRRFDISAEPSAGPALGAFFEVAMALADDGQILVAWEHRHERGARAELRARGLFAHWPEPESP